MAILLNKNANKRELVLDKFNIKIEWVSKTINIILKYNWHLNHKQSKSCKSEIKKC